MAIKIRYAPDAFRLLNGVFCVFKQKSVTGLELRKTIRNKLVEQLNEMDLRPPKERVVIEGSFKQGSFTTKVVPSYADTPAVVGPRYSYKDMKVVISNTLGEPVSGVTVVGIGGRGCYLANELKRANHLRTYEVKIRLGKQTNTHWADGIVRVKATHKHINKHRLDLVLSKIQAAQQTLMFSALGIDPTSQTAYEMASQGMVRPSSRYTSPIIYGLKCVHYDSPYVTLEMKVINENKDFFGGFVSDFGVSMKTVASIDSVRCTRCGYFTLEHALLEKHWTVEDVINNIALCKPLVAEDKIYPLTPNLKPPEKHQQSFLEMLERKRLRGRVFNKVIPA